MWIFRKVRGMSMAPTLRPGAVVIARKKPLKPGAIVVAEMHGRDVVKRVKSLKNGRPYLVGDNSLESTDSRELGPVKPEAVKGTVIAILPSATYDTRPLRSRIAALGLAAVILAMVTTQLIRFDTFVPILDGVFSTPLALVIGSSIVTLEVFGLPFLLGMALSPLARITSLACVWATVIGWTLWGFLSFSSYETGHLGSFITLRPGWWAPLCGGALIIMAAIASWQALRHTHKTLA